MSDAKYYWVYLPEIDEAGIVVQATNFADACRKGCFALYPDEGDEVQVHELGESQSFVAEASMTDADTAAGLEEE